MNRFKYLVITLLLITLTACNSRIGKIEMLNNLGVNEISGILVTKYDKNDSSKVYEVFLTENDESQVIKVLKKLNNKKLDYIQDVADASYSLEIETIDSSYIVYLNMIDGTGDICINDTWYESKLINKIYEVLDNISYAE